MNFTPKIAFVHDWLIALGGAEQTLAALLELWPEAPVYTLLYDPGGPCEPIMRGHPVYTSFLQRMPGSLRNHRPYLPLMPLAIEQFDLSQYDLIISSSHAVAKGILPTIGQIHISYIHTPMRYAWDLQHQYLKESGLERGMRSAIARLILHYIRLWDLASAGRVNAYIANSHYVAQRVCAIYQREAHVIYPPVDVNAFTLREQKDSFYLAISRLVPYKRIDLLVEAFSQMPEKRLVVIGDGPELKSLRAKASKNIEFLGFQPLATLVDHLQRARALLIAAEADFGIVAVEAQACGTPVIAYRKGGVLESVSEGSSGLFFDEQTEENLIQAVERFENQVFVPHEIRKNAERFSKARFQQEFIEFVGRFTDKFAG